MVIGWNRYDDLLVRSINRVRHGYCSGFMCSSALLCFIYGLLFLAIFCMHASKKERRACLSLRACGFKHFSACNLGLVCLIVIGLARCCVSRVGRFSFSSV